MNNKNFDDFFTEEKVKLIYYSARQDAAEDLELLYERFINNLPEEDESQRILKEWASFIVKQSAEIIKGSNVQDTVLRDFINEDDTNG